MSEANVRWLRSFGQTATSQNMTLSKSVWGQHTNDDGLACIGSGLETGRCVHARTAAGTGSRLAWPSASRGGLPARNNARPELGACSRLTSRPPLTSRADGQIKRPSPHLQTPPVEMKDLGASGGRRNTRFRSRHGRVPRSASRYGQFDIILTRLHPAVSSAAARQWSMANRCRASLRPFRPH